jgi:DNA-binding beta-propeller fold protein YncE
MRLPLIALCTLLSALGLAACATSQRPVTYVPQEARELVAPHPVAHWTQASIGTFGDPYGVAVDQHCSGHCDVFVSDPGTKTVYLVKGDSSRIPFADTSKFGPDFDPQGIGYMESGKRLLIADKGSNGAPSFVAVASLTGWHARLADSHAERPKYNRAVAGYAYYNSVKDQAAAVYAAQATYHPLVSKGAVACVQGPSCIWGSSVFSDPYGVAVDGSGTLFVVDARDKKAYSVSRHDFHELGMTFVDPYGVAVTADGKYVYVADAGAKKVYQRAPDGVWSEIGTFADPYAVAVQADRTLYVADPGSRHVWRLTPP